MLLNQMHENKYHKTPEKNKQFTQNDERTNERTKTCVNHTCTDCDATKTLNSGQIATKLTVIANSNNKLLTNYKSITMNKTKKTILLVAKFSLFYNPNILLFPYQNHFVF